MKLLRITITLFSGIITPAFAADLPTTKGPPSFIAPVPVANWSGFYGGLNLGYGFTADPRDSGSQLYYSNSSGDTGTETNGPGGPAWSTKANLNGVLGGAQAGYNYRFNPFVVAGVEADFQGAGLRGGATAADTTVMILQPIPVGGPNLWPVTATAAVTEHVDWFGTVRGRIGVTTFNDALLVYATGGLAYGQVGQSFNYAGGFLPDAPLGFFGSHWNGVASSSSVKIGWTAGAGLEWLLPTAPHWSVKAEYLFTDLGSSNLVQPVPAFRNSNGTGGRTSIGVNKIDAEWQLVRVGLNYHFY